MMGSFVVLPGMLFLPVQLGVFYVILTGVPGLAGVMYAVKSRLMREQFKYTLFFNGFKKFYLRALVLGLIAGLLVVTVISTPMLFGGMFSIFTINIYDNLLLKYEKDKA